MIEVNKNTLASALPALGKLICRTSPLMLCKSIKIESENGKLKLSSCGLNEEVSYELETESSDNFSCKDGDLLTDLDTSKLEWSMEPHSSNWFIKTLENYSRIENVGTCKNPCYAYLRK